MFGWCRQPKKHRVGAHPDSPSFLSVSPPPYPSSYPLVAIPLVALRSLPCIAYISPSIILYIAPPPPTPSKRTSRFSPSLALSLCFHIYLYTSFYLFLSLSLFSYLSRSGIVAHTNLSLIAAPALPYPIEPRETLPTHTAADITRYRSIAAFNETANIRVFLQSLVFLLSLRPTARKIHFLANPNSLKCNKVTLFLWNFTFCYLFCAGFSIYAWCQGERTVRGKGIILTFALDYNLQLRMYL